MSDVIPKLGEMEQLQTCESVSDAICIALVSCAAGVGFGRVGDRDAVVAVRPIFHIIGNRVECKRREVLRLEHISGTYMLADLLTKAVSRPIFLQLMELLDAYARTGVSALHS